MIQANTRESYAGYQQGSRAKQWLRCQAQHFSSVSCWADAHLPNLITLCFCRNRNSTREPVQVVLNIINEFSKVSKFQGRLNQAETQTYYFTFKYCASEHHQYAEKYSAEASKLPEIMRKTQLFIYSCYMHFMCAHTHTYLCKYKQGDLWSENYLCQCLLTFGFWAHFHFNIGLITSRSEPQHSCLLQFLQVFNSSQNTAHGCCHCPHFTDRKKSATEQSDFPTALRQAAKVVGTEIQS